MQVIKTLFLDKKQVVVIRAGVFIRINTLSCSIRESVAFVLR